MRRLKMAADVGIDVPSDFDSLLKQGAAAPLNLYVWGESLLKDRIILTATLDDLFAAASGRESPVNVEPVMLGDAENLSIQQRLLPLMILMAVVLGGSIVPAFSLVDEKQKRTLKALIITPASLEEVFLSKGLLA
jgi:ABC-2 type transport system permease protein